MRFSLLVLVPLLGCHAVDLNRHAWPDRGAALKVRPYVRVADAKRTVPALEVVVRPLHPASARSKASVDGFRRGWTKADRHLVFPALPAGSYDVRLFDGQERLLRRVVELRDGERLTLRVDLESLALYGPRTLGESFLHHLGGATLPEGWEQADSPDERILRWRKDGTPGVTEAWNRGLADRLEADFERFGEGLRTRDAECD